VRKHHRGLVCAAKAFLDPTSASGALESSLGFAVEIALLPKQGLGFSPLKAPSGAA